MKHNGNYQFIHRMITRNIQRNFYRNIDQIQLELDKIQQNTNYLQNTIKQDVEPTIIQSTDCEEELNNDTLDNIFQKSLYQDFSCYW